MICNICLVEESAVKVPYVGDLCEQCSGLFALLYRKHEEKCTDPFVCVNGVQTGCYDTVKQQVRIKRAKDSLKVWLKTQEEKPPESEFHCGACNPFCHGFCLCNCHK